jgi:hypothetical protein
MKTCTIFLILFAIYCSPFNALAQPGFYNSSLFYPDSSLSPTFGYDIFINDQPAQDQQHAVVCSAFNGWLFAAYSYDKGGVATATIMKSTDAGKTWTQLFEDGIGVYNNVFTKIDLIAPGNTEENIKVFIGFVFYDTVHHGGSAILARINGNDGSLEGFLLLNGSGRFRDLAIATDYPYPAMNSNPFSIGLIYSVEGTYQDSVVFYSSDDGGMKMKNRRVIATGNTYYHKVDLAYGYSPPYNSGRYFALWEEQADEVSTFGHIYSARSEPGFNSPFTTPVCLDCPDASLNNNCRNPVTACQISDADNDSSGLTQAVLFEYYSPTDHNFQVRGSYNLLAASGDNFESMTIGVTSGNKVKPEICFNTFDSSFMVTYFDSTNQKLPFIKNDFNLTDPDGWEVVSPGYNDNANLFMPEPRLALNYEKQTCMVSWNAEMNTGKGAAMYDAEYIYYTGIQGNENPEQCLRLKTYPNPCSSIVTIEFEMQTNEKTEIALFDLLGKPVRQLCNRWFPPGRNIIKTNISDLPEGSYVCRLICGKGSGSAEIILIK